MNSQLKKKNLGLKEDREELSRTCLAVLNILSEMEISYKENIPFEIEDKTKSQQKTNNTQKFQEMFFFLGQLELTKDVFINIFLDFEIGIEKIRGLIGDDELLIQCVLIDEENLHNFEFIAAKITTRLNEFSCIEVTDYWVDDNHEIMNLVSFLLKKNIPLHIQKKIINNLTSSD